MRAYDYSYNKPRILVQHEYRNETGIKNYQSLLLIIVCYKTVDKH